MLSRLQLKNLPCLQYRQISSNLCVTHKLATFPTSQYPQFFKHKIELTKKFGTFLSQDPVSIGKKELFVQYYVSLYPIFLGKKFRIYVAMWQNLCIPTKVLQFLLQIPMYHTNLPAQKLTFSLTVLHISDANYRKLCS